MLSGVPSANGTFEGTISAMNSGGTDSETFTMTILPPAPVITSGLTASGTNGVPFNYQITASNGPTSFNATGLPAGLNVNPTTGAISGTPASGGTFAAAISAANAGGTGSATLAITLNVAFAGVKGSYAGLASLGGTNLGLFTLSLTPTGSFTGKLTLASVHYPLKGAFPADGIYHNTVTQGAITEQMTLSVDPSVPGVSGTVAIIVPSSGATTNYTVAGGLLGTFKNGSLLGVAGSYTAVMPGVSGSASPMPQASGYGTMSVGATGAVKVAGKLGDGTAFKAAGQLHADQKTVTLFTVLYSGKNPGSIAGNIILETSTNSDWDGILDWVKPGQLSGEYYPGGFSLGVDLMAAKYVGPALDPGSAVLTLGGGDLPDPAVSGTLTIAANSKVTVSGTSGVTLTLTPKTGAFSGKFIYPGTNKKTSFGGVIYQMPTAAGIGNFMGADQCGHVEISQ